jgi:hypothetical protein
VTLCLSSKPSLLLRAPFLISLAVTYVAKRRFILSVRDKEGRLKTVKRLALFKVSRVKREEVKSIVGEGEGGLL